MTLPSSALCNISWVVTKPSLLLASSLNYYLLLTLPEILAMDLPISCLERVSHSIWRLACFRFFSGHWILAKGQSQSHITRHTPAIRSVNHVPILESLFWKSPALLQVDRLMCLFQQQLKPEVQKLYKCSEISKQSIHYLERACGVIENN